MADSASTSTLIICRRCGQAYEHAGAGLLRGCPNCGASAVPMRHHLRHNGLVAILSVLALIVLAGPGCAALSTAPDWPRAGQGESRTKGGASGTAAESAARLVEEALRKQGLAFGTDGSVEALYSYLRARHQVVPACEARVGDIVFFNTRDEKDHCGSHAGVVDGVRPGGEGPQQSEDQREMAVRLHAAHLPSDARTSGFFGGAPRRQKISVSTARR